MLGAAHCQRCGSPVLGADGAAVAPPIAAEPTRDTDPGFAPPPPPPPGWQPPPTTDQPRRLPSRAAVRTALPTGLLGCGCLLPAIAAIAVPLGIAVFAVNQWGDQGGEVQDEGVLEVDERAAGGIGAGDTDRWRLDGEGRIVQIDVARHGGFDPVVTLRDAGGRELGHDDDSGDNGRDSRLRAYLGDGATYLVDVTGFGGHSTGDYEVVVSYAATTEGGTLIAGAPVDGLVADDAVALYEIEGTGATVTITVRGVDGFDPVVTAYDADGVVLGANDDTFGRDASLSVSAAAGERIVVVVSSYLDRAGSYTIEVA